ncbi:MAG: ADP-ribosylglycohydrolase, partial [Alteromonas sp.]|nr:ADP-ribosylglycohydrolase [Alteromonas sp.]
EKEQLVIDCAPSALAELHEANDETHHVCNICGSVIFVERGSNQVSVEVTFSGHDVLAESHCQFVF